MLFDAVFYADSEYHVYILRKPIFDSQNLEIRVEFSSLLQIIDFLDNGKEFQKTVRILLKRSI